MNKRFERVGKVVAVGLAAGIGVAACGRSVKTSPSTSAEVRMQSEITGIRSNDTSFFGSNAINNDGIEKTWVAVLPNGEQVDLQVTYPADVNSKNVPTGKYNASAVEGIDVSFYNPGANFKNTKPEAAYDLGKEVDGKWDATYYQFLSQNSPFSISEENQSKVQTQASPGSIPIKSTTNVAEAHNIYAQVVRQVETAIYDVSQDTDIHISPNEIKT